jgi:hypothetical protein
VYYGCAISVWFCAKPATNASLTVTVTPTALMSGVNCYLYSVTNTTLAYGIPSFLPISDIASGSFVTSLQGETGALTLTSTGATVTITTPTANTINLEAGGSTGASTQFWGYPEGMNGWGIDQPILEFNSAQIGGGANAIVLWAFNIPYQVSLKHLGILIGHADASNTYDFGIYNAAGTLLANTGAKTYSAASGATVIFNTVTQGTPTVGPGLFFFAWTSSAAGSLGIYVNYEPYSSFWQLNYLVGGLGYWFPTVTASSSSTLPASITPPTFKASSTTGVGGGTTPAPTGTITSAAPVFCMAAF